MPVKLGEVVQAALTSQRTVCCCCQGIDDTAALHTAFLYFHTKGMAHHGRHTSRPEEEFRLFTGTIVPWQKVASVFEANQTITRIGMYPAKDGWMWFNFWWARASYVKGLTLPIRTARRHYYESWLGLVFDPATLSSAEPGVLGGCHSCYSMNGNCSGHGIEFVPEAIGAITNCEDGIE